MPLQLISATPSPYARKVRITLAEKGIPFELITEVPWEHTTITPQHNPLEKLPVLILEDGTSVYESSYILEYVEAKLPGNGYRMLSDNIDAALLAKKIDVVCSGIMDAVVLLFFEKQRERPSEEWKARQLRKVDGGFRALAEWVGEGKEFLIEKRFGLADVSVGCVCGYIDVRFKDYQWRQKYPAMAKYVDMLGERKSFQETVPVPQTIVDKIV